MSRSNLAVLAPFFVMFAVFFAMIGLLIVFRKRIASGALKPRVRRPLKLWESLVGACVVVGLYSLLSAGLGRGSLLINALSSIQWVLIYLPMFILTGAFRVEKCEPACSKCGYDVAALVGEAGPPAPRCPECGHPLSGMFAIKTERLRIDKRRLWIGLALVLPVLVNIGALFAGYYLDWRPWIAKVSPTGSLVKHVGANAGVADVELNELLKRAMSDSQRDDLAKVLILECRPYYLDAAGTESKWLVAEFRAGRMTPGASRELLRRFTWMRSPMPGELSEIHLSEEQAWGLGGAFKGWSMFVVRNSIRDEHGAKVQDRIAAEVPLSVTELETYPTTTYPARPSITGFAQLGVVRPDDRTHVWVIAEPRARGAGAVEWKDGAPVTAGDAIVVEFQIGKP